MKFDDYGRAYLSSDDLCALLYKNPKTSFDDIAVTDPDSYNSAISKFYLELSPLKKYEEINDVSLAEFDYSNTSNWHMPSEYKNLNIVDYIVELCKSDDELNRVAEELLLFQERNLFDLLRFLKYMVDVFKTHDVVYGIGRGSSTASYVLYLLGVHKVNSIMYELDIREFLK
jgi:DNA polymerase III alpha subunit